MNSYVEHVRQPVGRGAEKFFGWFAWIITLGVTALSLFAALVVLNNPTNINRLETLIEQLNINITSNGQILTSSQIALNIQNGIWLFIIYLIIVLIFSFIGLVLMRWRIFSALVFLLLSVVTLPLFIVLVPLFFFITSILLFIRKDKILPVEGMRRPEPMYNEPIKQPEERKPIPPQEPVQPRRQEKQVETEPEINENEAQDSGNDEILSRTRKYQKNKRFKEPVAEEEKTETTETDATESEEKDVDEVDENGEIGQRSDDPYSYQTTQPDDYQVTSGVSKKEKKPKKVKPNATIERRKNYEKRMEQQRKQTKAVQEAEELNKNDNKG
ncbi:hypothetical protein L1F34_001805 [Mammaliicoccus lentus]|uniref:DUF4064 domain-containing protein n=1 Tax=Mammaliicoccus lentus TaxID=42858 RepID=UPI0039E8B41F